MDINTLSLAKEHTNQEIFKVNQTINQLTSGIKSITANGSILTFTLSDNSQISVTLTGLSDNNYTTIDKNKLQSIDTDLINKFSYNGTQLLFDGQPIQGNSIDLSNYYNKDEAKAQFNVKPTNYLYVSKNGNDTTGDGSANKPFLTVQKAIDTATSGTTIFIFPATYNENLTFKANVYLTASVKYGVYITGNHTVDYTGTAICENIVLNSSSGITLNFQGTNAQTFQLLGCSIDSTNGHAINWTNTNASSKIYSEDSVTNVSSSSSSAKAFYSSSTAKGSFIANRYSFKINNPDNICLDVAGAINFTHTGDQIIGQVIVSNTATVTIGSMVMTTLTTPVLTTNSTGMTTIASTIVNTTSSPIITGVGAFSYVAILYGNTGVGGASSLNGGLGAIALPMSSVKLRNASLIPNSAVALGYASGSLEYDGSNLYFTKGTTRDKVAMMGDIPNLTAIQGDILPSTNGTQNIGSPTNRFDKIYVNEAMLSTNTLYIGDTPVLGTNQDTIVIKGDVDQSVTMKTSGVGTTKVISGSGVELSTSGMNANVTVQATGNGSNANIGATNQINLNAPNINIQGTSTDVKGAMAVDNLTIRGDVTINGGATTIQSTIVQVEDNIIELNKGEVGYGVTAGRAGLKIDRGDADDYLIIFDETDNDSLKIGTDSVLKKVATENYVDIQDDKKADKVHNHDISDITGILPSTQLPIATSSNIGGVKAGTNITISADGTISASSSGGISTWNTFNL